MISVTGHAVTAPETTERMRPLWVAHWADIGALKAHFTLPESRQFVRTLRALSPATGAMQICPVTETAP